MKKNTLLLILFLFGLSGWTGIYAETDVQQQQSRILTGVVTDELGEPLIGVSVTVSGTGIGATTNIEGEFSLNFPANATKIEIAYLGYEKIVRNIASGENNLRITMKENAQLLDEVVVVGYGSARKRDLTGAVSHVKTEKLEKEAPGSVQDLLRANIPGLSVSYNTSAKGGGDVEIRGTTSLKASNSPLIVLDGVIFKGELSEIITTDIAQIDILKDASSAAVYGSKSAAGVLLITTKKGKKGKPVVRFDVDLGFVTMGGKAMEVYGTEGYLNWRTDVMKSTNATHKPGEFEQPTAENLAKYGITMEEWMSYRPGSGDPTRVWLSRLALTTTEIDNYFAGRTFDWKDYSFQTGLRQSYGANVSGSADNINYYFSLGYMNNEGLVVGDEYQTYRSNIKLDMDITKWLNIGLNINFQERRQDGQTVAWSDQMNGNSPYSLPTDTLGNLVRYPMGTNSGSSTNSAFDISYRNQRNGWTTINNILTAKVKFPFNITYEMNFAPRLVYHYWQKHESSQHPDWKSSNNGLAERQSTRTYNWQIDNIIRWNYTFNNVHHTELTLLQNAEENKYWEETMTGRNFSPTDALGYSYMDIADMTKSSISSKDEHQTSDALMARAYYAFKDRYMLTASIRRDGYSGFGIKNPRATFPSIALGWVFTEEDFMSKAQAMNYGKIRLSYGQNGNSSIGTYQALSDMTKGAGRFVYIDSKGTLYETSQLYVSRMANADLKWETTTSFNVGWDYGFLNQRINGSIDAYYSKTTDVLVDRTLPDFLGFSNVAANLGQIDNKGLEFIINTQNIKRDNFEWYITASFNTSANKIVHLYRDYADVTDENGNIIGQKETDDTANAWFIGRSIYERANWGYRMIGVWQEDEAEEAKKYSQVPGDPKIWDVNEDGKYTNDDKVFNGQSTPKFSWTLRNEFVLFKDLTISTNIYSMWGQKFAYDRPLNRNGFLDRNSSYIQPYWTPENPTNGYARLQSNDASTGVKKMVNRSFIRLDNIAVSYNVPKKFIQTLNIQKLNVYASVRNVAVWAPDWVYWDPEPQGRFNPTGDSPSTSPTPRTWTIGFNVTL
ncbi:MAG: SusC/RagA family TonB-linked outer membrane protein [Dysgonamonadaceae bacterium]|jgi:TonB-linked SusC/RagA family outer membrane protein|nr:SusC/RagA family TonB-linked outer membrane protein [Dysgonamonadaceae bacterium]